MNVSRITLVGMALCLTAQTHAATDIDLWEASSHKSSGGIQYAFRVANTKRGLFFGLGGIGTRSLQWQYHVAIAGPGPVYTAKQVELADRDW